jgi:hypothetical protein
MEKAVVKPDYDAIFCQSFGRRKYGPGLSNQYLAKLIIKLYDKNPKPLIIQKDCADAMPSRIKIDKIIDRHQNPKKYLDSFEVSRQCAEYCHEHNIKSLIVFAHPDHLGRVLMTIRKFGVKAIAADTKGAPYDSSSEQIWTRDRVTFIAREILTWLYYFLFRKL